MISIRAARGCSPAWVSLRGQSLKGVLTRARNRLDKSLLVSLLKNFAAIPIDLEGDAFGKIYEYLLGKFAMTEGQKGGGASSPPPASRLIVEIIEPFQGAHRLLYGLTVHSESMKGCRAPHSLSP